MLGTAGLLGLRVDCVVGIYPQERLKTQPVILDVEFDYDFAAAAVSENIGDAVDYAVAAQCMTQTAQRGFQLIETMAEEMVTALFQRFPPLVAVRLEVRKPEAVPAAQCSFVRLERKRTK